MSFLVIIVCFSSPTLAQRNDGLLFYLSGNESLNADYAAGDAIPNFSSGVTLNPDGYRGKSLLCSSNQRLSYWAPGNIFAQRGTVSFFWRAVDPFTPTEFPIFRVGYADHSSWDMVWLRIDYNGHGFDAFVTDVNLARVRVSYTIPKMPAPDEWTHFTFTWEETEGVRFYLNGVKVAQKDSVVVLDAGLDQFGPHSRVISPYQVQSAYNFVRGGEMDEIRIFDRALDDKSVAALAKDEMPQGLHPIQRDLSDETWGNEWALRYGLDRRNGLPPSLSDGVTTIRKIGLFDIFDEKRWWWKGNDGVRETTWPGVYNRSRIPGRNDYFQLPDWDCYSTSGMKIRFNMPEEQWNYVEISGGADGDLSLTNQKDGTNGKTFSTREKPVERSFHKLDNPVIGQTIVFTNNQQETPIGEFDAFYIHEGDAPVGIANLTYTVSSRGSLDNPYIADIVEYINGRYQPDERSIMLASRGGGRMMMPGFAMPQAANTKKEALPIVHVIIPCETEESAAGSWVNINAGLDGIKLTIPAFKVNPFEGGKYPMNVKIKDPLWPIRSMFDVSFSLTPGKENVVWLDMRDRILPNDRPLYMTFAFANGDFDASMLEGMKIEMIFKPWEEAKEEHVEDRFTQVRDTYAMIVEEATSNRRLNKYKQIEQDMTDLLRVDKDHLLGRSYWYLYNKNQPKPAFELPERPDDVPAWAFWQLELLKNLRQQLEWYIDNRQVDYGEFGGGISDDTDICNWFPALIHMGDIPDKVEASLALFMSAIDRNGTLTNGMSTIQSDGLHTFEEGANTVCQINIVRLGQTEEYARLIESAVAVRDILLGVNSAGHTHFRSDYFSATKIATEGVWTWSSSRESLHLSPAMLLGEYYGNESARKNVIDMADGFLAHSHVSPDGRVTVDTRINFVTDESTGGSLGHNTHVLWAAYLWTGQEKYLRPLLDEGESAMTTVSSNMLDYAPGLRAKLTKTAPQWTEMAVNNSFSKNHLNWQLTGDKRFLETYYKGQVEEAKRMEYINTYGNVWTDRFVFDIEGIQRSRMGGITMNRNKFMPGNNVSWRFDADYEAEKVAILIPDATRSKFSIELYNVDNRTVEADMTGWDVLGGTWEMVTGIDTDNDGTPDADITKERVKFGRNQTVHFSIPSRKSMLVSMSLIGKGTEYNKLPDLAIGKKDVSIEGNNVIVKVANLGWPTSKASSVAVVDANDKSIVQVTIPPIEGATNMVLKTKEVTMTLPQGVSFEGCSVVVDPQNKLSEIIENNNEVKL